MTNRFSNIYEVAERAGTDYQQTLRAAELAGKTPTGAIYYPADTSPVVALTATRWILETDNVQFSGMVFGNMPSYSAIR